MNENEAPVGHQKMALVREVKMKLDSAIKSEPRQSPTSEPRKRNEKRLS